MGRQLGDGLTYVDHRLVRETFYVGLRYRVIIGAGIEGVYGIGNLRVAYHYHGIDFFFTIRQTRKRKVVLTATLYKGVIEIGRTVGGAMGRHLAPRGHCIKHKAGMAVAAHAVTTVHIGNHATHTIAHHHAWHRMPLYIGQRAVYAVNGKRLRYYGLFHRGQLRHIPHNLGHYALTNV